jgi:predicted RNA-binding Zn-ribbon protein involved in translation (DUF1610 family)
MSKPKILTLDIETAPLKVYNWSLWQDSTSVNMIHEEWEILAVCAKWLGKKPMYRDRRGESGDGSLLMFIWGLLDEADIVITQNGKSFDIKKINARLIAEGFKPYSPIRQIDTKEVAHKHFGFTSNKLEWMGKNIAKVPKSDHKKFPGFELWTECLKGNIAAWNEMKKYNIQDVVATEKLYLKMRPWIEGHPNLATYSAHSTHPECPKCGSATLQRRGSATTQTGVYPRLCCTACGGWSRGRKTELPPARNKLLLSN